jgi:precorrin-6Y C5,15-methyltransferase (decarboxylating)
MEQCRSAGLFGRQLICMQGPFSARLNRAMYLHTDAKILVTKESGDAGGYGEKIRPALALGMHCIVIRRPKETGFSYAQVCERLGLPREETEASADPQKKRLYLTGIGPGGSGQLTREASEAFEQAQVIFGARRMLDSLSGYPVEKIEEYRGEKVAEYLRQHPNVSCAAVAFSGDVGFYSGADGFEKSFAGMENWQLVRLPGISSLSYFAAALGIPGRSLFCAACMAETPILRDRFEEIKRYLPC